MRMDANHTVFMMLAALSACGQVDTVESHKSKSLAKNEIVFGCRSGRLSHEMVRRTEENNTDSYTYIISDDKKRTISKKIMPTPSYAFETFGSGGIYQLLFVEKNYRILIFSGNSKIKDKYGEYHIGDFKDGIIEFDKNHMKSVQLCDDPYHSDIAWVDFEETLPSAPILDINRIMQ